MGKLFASASRVDITPKGPVWLDGMIRSHPSEGVHDPIAARCLVLSNSPDVREGCALVSVEVCAIAQADADLIRREVEQRTGLSAERIMVCATHAHSSPATYGFFNPKETGYTGMLRGRIVDAVESAARRMVPAKADSGRSEASGVSHYRRLLSKSNRVIMNWEQLPPEGIIGPLGVPDPEIDTLRVSQAEHPGTTIALLFHHAGHPNTLSGENYQITAEYPGLASRLLEERWGGEALYLNGAQGSVDIDNDHDRGWEGLARLGTALASAASRSVEGGLAVEPARICAARRAYTVAARRISRSELQWADEVLGKTGGAILPVADGVGDDFKAKLYRRLYEAQKATISIEQIGLSIGGCALISFPGELYTEVGLELKRRSPFIQTCLVGLANGYIGYVPTEKAIREGGYAEDTREVAESAASVILDSSLAILNDLHAQAMEEHAKMH